MGSQAGFIDRGIIEHISVTSVERPELQGLWSLSFEHVGNNVIRVGLDGPNGRHGRVYVSDVALCDIARAILRVKWEVHGAAFPSSDLR